VAKSASHFPGIPNDTGVTYGHAVSPYVNVTFSNLISEVAFSQPYFEPSLGQTQEVTATFAANCNWTLQIQDVNSNTVRNASGSGNSMTFDWDGTGDGETNIPDGVYTFLISAQTNGESSDISEGSSGGGGGSPPAPSFAASSSVSSDSSELWAMPSDGSGAVVPFALYPPGFDTNNLIIFEATPSEMQALESSLLGAKSDVATHGDSGMSDNNASPAYAGPSGQSTSAPMRPPDTKGKGTIGTFLVGYQTYFTALFLTFSTPPIPTGWPYPVQPQFVALDSETSSQAQNSETWAGNVFEAADIGNGFANTMQNSRWKGSINPTITASDVTGGFFNQANVGLLVVHGSYGKTAEDDGVIHSYLRFYKNGSASYARLDDCSFGGSGTNGLKWMGILGCGVLNNSPYNSMYNYGRLPINNDLHLLLAASTAATAAPTLGTLWAGYMLGTHGTNGVQTVEQAWFEAGHEAYKTETNQIVITFRVAGWPDAFNDYVTDTDTSPGTGDSLDITHSDQQVFP
ncbi:MAG: DUF6345 domain-containing protein, partial [Verrucomicrobiia bacterium]